MEQVESSRRMIFHTVGFDGRLFSDHVAFSRLSRLYKVNGIQECISHMAEEYLHHEFSSSLIRNIREKIRIGMNPMESSPISRWNDRW